jgi:transcriptional regulator with XRE-family HTH domain
MNYGKAFRICRAALGLKQSELAAQLDIGPSQLSLIESGKRQPSHKTIDDLCKTIGIPRSLLLLLASEPDDLKQEDPGVVKELAANLLKLFVEADEQQVLPFRKKF